MLRAFVPRLRRANSQRFYSTACQATRSTCSTSRTAARASPASSWRSTRDASRARSLVRLELLAWVGRTGAPLTRPTRVAARPPTAHFHGWSEEAKREEPKNEFLRNEKLITGRVLD